jgi:hypothetical protein
MIRAWALTAFLELEAAIRRVAGKALHENQVNT